VSVAPGAGGIVASSSFAGSVTNDIPVGGTLTLNLVPPSSLGVGAHVYTVPINICFDPACSKPATGSPFPLQISYIVDPVEGINFSQQVMNFSVGGLVWDATTQRLYASVPDYSTQYQNSIVRINPVTATVETSITFDSGAGWPINGTLTLSDDGQYLYVAVSDAFTKGPLAPSYIDRIRTSDMGDDLHIPVNNYGDVTTIREAPGLPHTLAVSFDQSGLSIFNDATIATNSLSFTSDDPLLGFTWGGNDSALYAYSRDQSTQTGTIATATVSPTGLVVAQSTTSSALASLDESDSPLWINGSLFWNSGLVYDLTANAFAQGFTLFGDSQAGGGGGGAFDTSLDRAYFFGGGPGLTIEGFQLDTRQFLWLARLPSSLGGEGPLVRWGANGLAFPGRQNAQDALVILSGPLITQ
jgi:hypothetical protein